MTGRPMPAFERFSFPDVPALLEKIHALGLSLPISENLEALFQPIEMGGRRLANRLAVQPMEGADGDALGAPGPLTFRRYRRFAGGGAALVWFEATAIRPGARSNPSQLCLTPETRDAFARLVEEVRRAARESMGPDHPVCCILQLTHPGRFTREGESPRPVIARHHPRLDDLVKIPPDHPLVTDEALDALQDDYLRSARLAAEAGFDGVDVKACHGYLVSELLGARERRGRYGGPFEHRTRFLVETVRRIHDTVPELLVAVRFNAWDGLPRNHGFGAPPEDTEGFQEPRTLAALLRNTGASLLNVTLGFPALHPYLTRPFDSPASGKEPPSEHPLSSVNRLLRAAAHIQDTCPGLPVVSSGYSWLRHLFPFAAAGMVEHGHAAFAGMGRMAFAYPDCVKELQEKGRLDLDKCCVTCSACSRLLKQGGPAGCRVRDGEVYGKF